MDPHQLPVLLDWRESPAALRPPIRYDPELEQVGPDEPEMAQALCEAIQDIARRTCEARGRAYRGVHAKGFGILKGEIEIPEGLPVWLAQGLFAGPARHAVVMRFSSLSGDLLPDSVSLPRGCAVKVLGVEGRRIAGAPEEATQDFVLANSRTFNGRNAQVFLGALRALAMGTERAQGAKAVISAGMRWAEGLLERLGLESPELKGAGGQPLTHPLGEAYFSQLPLRWGDHVGKLVLVPAAPWAERLRDAPLQDADAADAVRRAINDHVAAHGVVFRLGVQLCNDPRRQPIEDGADDWPEALCPFFEVAVLRFAPQSTWVAGQSERLEASLGFTPWNGLEDHTPLGALMRLRRLSYDTSRRTRQAQEGGEITTRSSAPAVGDRATGGACPVLRTSPTP